MIRGWRSSEEVREELLDPADNRSSLVREWRSARKEDRHWGSGRGRREQIVSRSLDRNYKLNRVKRRGAGHGRPPPHRQQSMRCASLTISSDSPRANEVHQLGKSAA